MIRWPPVRIYENPPSRIAGAAPSMAEYVAFEPSYAYPKAFSSANASSGPNQSVFGVDRAVAAFGAGGFIAGAFDTQARLSKRSIMIGFQALGGRERCLHASRRTSRQKRGGDGRIDLLATHLQAANAAPVDHSARPAVVGRRGVSAIVEYV